MFGVAAWELGRGVGKEECLRYEGGGMRSKGGNSVGSEVKMEILQDIGICVGVVVES